MIQGDEEAYERWGTIVYTMERQKISDEYNSEHKEVYNTAVSLIDKGKEKVVRLSDLEEKIKKNLIRAVKPRQDPFSYYDDKLYYDIKLPSEMIFRECRLDPHYDFNSPLASDEKGNYPTDSYFFITIELTALLKPGYQIRFNHAATITKSRENTRKETESQLSILSAEQKQLEDIIAKLKESLG